MISLPSSPWRSVVALFCALSLALAARATVNTALQAQLGNPSGATADANNHAHFLLERPQFAFDYNDTTRDPNWVSWDLTAGDHGSVPRSNFIPDPDLPAGFYAVTTNDYNGVGDINFNRGHMCPSADRNDTTTNNQVLFYMSNILPQSADNNQGPWEAFETECRNLAAAGNELLIISGPSLFGGAKIPSNIADIPNFVWKIAVVVPSGPGTALSRIDASTRVIALKMPNINGIRSNPWTDYVVSASEIEGDTGYTFFTNLPAPVAAALRVKIDSSGSGGGTPVITTQPISQSALPGGSVTFSVGATGGSLTYQWRKDGDEIAGATNPTLTLTNVTIADQAGYDVVVTNAIGSIASSVATLTISTPTAPTITTQPTNQSVTAGGNATFTVVATGLPAPTYAWFKNADVTPIPGATTATLTLTNVQATDSGGTYHVEVTNSVGTAISNSATLTVVSVPPTITTQPSSQSVSPGANVTFTVAATGSAPLSYQWRKNGTPIGGATSTTLSLTNVQTADGGSYDVLVTNFAGSVASNLAVLSISVGGTTTTTTQINYAGGAYTQNFDSLPSSGTFTYSGNGPFFFNNSPISSTGLGGWSFAKYNGTGANATFQVNNGSSNAGAVYSYGTGTASDRALGSISSGTVISRFGAVLVNTTGQTITQFTLGYSGEEWRRGSASANVLTFSYLVGGTDINTGTFTNVSGLNFTAPNTAGSNAALDGNSTASPVNKTIIAPQTVNVTWAPGQTLVLRWTDVDDSGSDDGIAIDDLTFTTSVAGAVPTVAVVSTTPAANATNVSITAPITVTFNQAVSFNSSSFTISSALNGPVAATVTGGPTTYTLTPTSAFSYSDTISVNLLAAQIADAGTGTTHPTSNYAFSFQTAAPTPPAIATQPKSQAVVVGGTVSLTVSATGTAPLSYQWRKGGVNLSDGGVVSGSATAALTLTGVSLADAGNYDVVVNNVTNAPATSNAAVLTVSTTPIAPSIDTAPQPQTVAAGGTATFHVVAAGTTPFTYQWRRNGVNLANGAGIAGATSDTLVLSNVTFSSAGNYDVVVSNGTSPDATSAAAALNVTTAAGASVLYFNGGTYTQNFDTLPAAGTFSFANNGPFSLDATVGATGMPGWTLAKYSGSGSAVIFRVDTGSSNSGGATSYGLSSSPDRALGSISSGSVVSRFGVLVVNNTGATITHFTLGYAGEQWRHGGATTPNTLSFSYAVGATDINTGSFTNATALDYVTTNVSTTSGALNGNLSANRALIAGQVTGINWLPGQLLVLRWSDVDDGGADDGIAVDDLTFTLDAPAAPVFTTQPLAQTVTVGGGVTFTAAATGTPAPLYQWRKGGVALTNGVTVAGATTPTLTLTNVNSTAAGDYDVVASNGVGAPVASALATLTVNKAAATVTLGSLAANYDGLPHAATATTSPAGLAVTFVYGEDANPNPPINAGSYTVVATINDANYAGSATGTLVIAQAASTITWNAPAAITYGTALGAAQLNATANTPGTFVYTPAAGTVLNAGTNQTLSVSFTPADAVNFTTASATTTITVNKATPAIAWATPAAITYGTALGAAQLNATASVLGTFTYTPAAGTVLNAGANQTLGVSFLPADAINYTPASFSTTITVNQATPVITWAAPAAITYGTALGAAQLNATANTPGTFTYTPAAGTVLNAGASQTLNVSFAPTDATNYTTASATTTITVDKATPALAWTAPGAITYGVALSSTQLAATADVAGTFVYTPAAGAVLNAGANQTLSAAFTPTDAGNYNPASVTTTITVNQATPTVTWSAPAAITYGTALGAAQLNATASVPGAFTYTPAAGAVLNAGANQTLSVSFAPTDAANYTTASATTTITVNKATSTITWPAPAAITYGTALGAAQLNATASVPGAFTYTPAAGTVLNAGANQTLSVSFAPTDATNYATASATTTITVNKATPALTWPAPGAITYGTALGAAQLNATANVPGIFVYTPGPGTVLGVGAGQTLSVAFTPNDAGNYTTASATTSITVNAATATLALSDLKQAYDGTPKSATVTTTPANLAVAVTYNGNATAPTLPGSYAVVATITDPNHSGTASGTLVITVTALVRHGPVMNGDIDGSLQVLLPESFTLNGGAMISGDALVPGTPTVQRNGNPTYGGTIDGTGNASPSNYQVTLNGNSVLRHVVRRTDAIAMPTVATPPQPAGTRSVSINSAGQSAGDFATLRNLTLNGNVGQYVIPAGTYGAFTANGGSGFTLGVANATTPSVYNLQSLVLNGNSQLQIAGPVIINLANGLSLNGNVGASGHSDWLVLNVASGSVTLNGNVTFHGDIVAPNGTVTINGNTTLNGHVAADRLTLNGNGLLNEP